MKENKGPLNGITIIDLTTEVLGPVGTQILGDFGADVIKIESLIGDPQRKNGFIMSEGITSIYISINRNKKSISVDLKTDDGKKILEALIFKADVIVHNIRMKATKRIGIDYESVKKINPKIIYCVATGFDQDGPNKDQPAFDDIVQAGSGIVHLNSLGKEAPEFLPTVIGDKAVGLLLSNSVIAALFHRERTGISQFIEIPLYESTIAFAMMEHMGGMTAVPQSGESGYTRILHKGRKPYPTKNGYFGMLPYTLEQWSKLFEIDDKVQLGLDLGIADRITRNLNFSVIYSEMSKITIKQTLDQMQEICFRFDIPFSKVNSPEELLVDEQLKEVKLFVEDVHPSAGRIRYIRPTVKFSETPISVRSLASTLGGDTKQVLVDLGYTEEEIYYLLERGIIKT